MLLVLRVEGGGRGLEAVSACTGGRAAAAQAAEAGVAHRTAQAAVRGCVHSLRCSAPGCAAVMADGRRAAQSQRSRSAPRNSAALAAESTLLARDRPARQRAARRPAGAVCRH